MAFASRDYFKDIHQNGAVLFYYVVLLLTWMSLLLVLVLIIRAELPRDYAELGSFTEFLTWRDAYAQELQEAGYSDAQSFEIANQKLGEEIVKKLAEAERVNRQTNVDRQELGNETLTGLIASGICVIVQIGLERMLSLERVVTW